MKCKNEPVHSHIVIGSAPSVWPFVGDKMSNVEKKWKANQEKVGFAKGFPGMIAAFEKLAGRKIEAVVPIEGKQVTLLILEKGEFAVISSMEPQPAELLAALEKARSYLEPHHPEAYASLDRLWEIDRETQRVARLENILGAIRNNLPQIPELKEELRKVLDENR